MAGSPRTWACDIFDRCHASSRLVMLGMHGMRWYAAFLGRDPFNQNFRKFRSKTQWIGSVQPEKFRKNRSTFWGGPLFPVGPVWILVEWMVTGLSPILKPREDKFFLVPHLFKSVYLGCFRGDLDKNFSETLWNYGSLEESFFIKKQGRIQDFS